MCIAYKSLFCGRVSLKTATLLIGYLLFFVFWVKIFKMTKSTIKIKNEKIGPLYLENEGRAFTQ